jgi:uncharacterized integral membrane protein (TIGR00698 family)
VSLSLQAVLRFVARMKAGLVPVLLIALVAEFQARLQDYVFGRIWLDAVVFAILAGIAVVSLRPLPADWHPGVRWAGKLPLEIAIVLIGATINPAVLHAAPPSLIVAVFMLVAIVLAATSFIGIRLGLPRNIALLIGSGNAICGNSAIVAAGRVIDAKPDEVASAIGFTAIIGVLMVLFLPVLATMLSLSALQFGAMAGLTIYAVPQVLAAAAPGGSVVVQFGMLVKLLRVLALGPMLIVLALFTGGRARTRWSRIVPWFIFGFALMLLLRSAGQFPDALVGPFATMSHLLTVVAIAALGLEVDLSALARSGPRIVATALLSLLLLSLLSFGLIGLIGLA